MKAQLRKILPAILSVCALTATATIRYVDLNCTNATPPFTNWPTAATNIQDAIDVASDGDVVWVTNGVYATGGKVMAGDLTNRVALDKALTVQSVNGPSVTTIKGQPNQAGVNGPDAVRCAWLTNGALLSGFTIQGGATRTGGDAVTLQNGGGVWCASANAVVTNCIILQNSSPQFGGGAYSGALNKCLIRDNSAARGGGAAYSSLNSCYVTGNTAGSGGGIYRVAATNCALFRNEAVIDCAGSFSFSDSEALVNCTLAENRAGHDPGGAGGYSVNLLNCILWNNQGSASDPNYAYGSYLTYCCTYPLPSGTGNISADPQLLADGAHLASTSPCRGMGSSTYATGTDIDGQNWATTPSIGCDEWYSAPLIIVPPKPRLTTVKDQVRVVTAAAGQEPFSFGWSKDGAPLDDGPHYAGTHTAGLLINGFGLGDAGEYQVVVTNAVGVVTSELARVVIHCVDALGTAASSPYTNWATAATTIQDAIEAAALTDVVLVTNGVYASGGKVKFDTLTNRVALDKAVLVTSVNGPSATIIQGQWDPATTNGPGAVRCAWLADGAGLSRFTLRDGATSGGVNGGGAYCSSTNAELFNCVITNCRASLGGGVYGGTLNRCTIVGNAASGGGGGYYSLLLNCLITHNNAKNIGGGVFRGWLYNCGVTENYAGHNGGGVSMITSLINCTVTSNSAGYLGGGIAYADSTSGITNCIVYFNYAPAGAANGGLPSSASYNCRTPIPSGLGNIADDPQLLDSLHLATTSPCRGMGSSLAAVGADMDGEPWASSPSMGCDEVWESALTGPLSVSLTAAYPEVAAYGVLPLTGQISGHAARLQWSFGDGATFTNRSYLTSYTWTNTGDYTVTLTAFNADNPSGVSANLQVQVVPLVSPLLTVGVAQGTNFSLSFPGQPGVTYVVEQTTNLSPPVVWQTVQTLTSTGGVMQVAFSNPTDPARFYRARTL